MTQVFADDEAATVGMFALGGRIPVQGIPESPEQSREAGRRELQPPGGPDARDRPDQRQPGSDPGASSPALMPGKGVRPVRCVGCCHDTLPRSDDGAPLCSRCSEVLANAETGSAPLAGSFTGWTVRWLRRRDAQLS